MFAFHQIELNTIGLKLYIYIYLFIMYKYKTYNIVLLYME